LPRGGSIYLDEIGDLDPKIQVKLLHFLEHRDFKRVGGVEMIQADVRVISATNIDLRRHVAAGSFREDLYYRLRVIPIHLPPVCERGEDCLDLAEHLLTALCTSFERRFRGFTAAAKRKLMTHRWPGNVRELRNVIERAVTLEDAEWIQPEMLAFDEVLSPSRATSGDSGGPDADGMTTLEEMERGTILTALERTNWNQVKAAELLKLGRDALRYRMKKYNLL